MKKTFLLLLALFMVFGLANAKPNKPIVVATYNLRQNNPIDGINA